MNHQKDHIRDITAMRSIMERSSRFMSISPLACVLVGIYALAGAWITYIFFDFHTIVSVPSGQKTLPPGFLQLIGLAIAILIMAVSTTIFLSYKRAAKIGEKTWNATVRRLMINMAVPLIAGGLLILILIVKGFMGLIVPCSLLFYGLALYNASKFTFNEWRSLGLIEIVLGLLSAYFTEYGLLCWALGFGIVHIFYGVLLHYRYEK